MGSRHRTEPEIRKILAEAAAGVSVREITRRHAINRKTFYRWKSRYESTSRMNGETFRGAKDENERLKRLVAEQALQIHALKEVLVAMRNGSRPGLGDRARSSKSGRRRRRG